MVNKQRKPESDSDLHPYEHSPLEPEAGFWDGKWTEFKRLFIELAWKNDHSREVLILSTVAIGVTLLGMRFLGWR